MDILVNELEFTPSMVDPCVFYRGDLTIVTYVDDCLIFTPKEGGNRCPDNSDGKTFFND